jgi:hypothetical protein
VINPFFEAIRRRCAPVLVTLLVSLSVLVPLLDRGELNGGYAFESEHDAATCVRAHDHTVCTQFGANHSIPSAAPRHGTVSHVAAALDTLADQLFAPQDLHTSHLSRAPPLG